MNTNIIGSHFQKFNSNVQNLTATGYVTSDCADILFVNTTALTVTTNGIIYVDNYPLNPGEYIAIGANDGELNKTQYLVTFQQAATGCTVVKKVYVND